MAELGRRGSDGGLVGIGIARSGRHVVMGLVVLWFDAVGLGEAWQAWLVSGGSASSGCVEAWQAWLSLTGPGTARHSGHGRHGTSPHVPVHRSCPGGAGQAFRVFRSRHLLSASVTAHPGPARQFWPGVARQTRRGRRGRTGLGSWGKTGQGRQCPSGDGRFGLAWLVGEARHGQLVVVRQARHGNRPWQGLARQAGRFGLGQFR
jgi:hypothetical protein